MNATTTARAATNPYTPPDLTVPESAAERHALYSRAILAAVKFMESRLSSPDEAAALDAAKTLLHLEETRLRHDRAVADAPAPKPPSTTPQLPPIRPIRRPDDLVGAEIDCWFGDMMGEVLGLTEPPVAANDEAAARKLRAKMAIVQPGRACSDEEIATMLQQLRILKADDDASHGERSA